MLHCYYLFVFCRLEFLKKTFSNFVTLKSAQLLSKIAIILFQEYEEVGAIITEDLSSATHIIGVKAPDPEELIEDKVWIQIRYGLFKRSMLYRLLD